MSLCDRCFAPGQCCRNITLTTAGQPIAVWDNVDPQQGLADQTGIMGLPFEPLERLGQWTATEGADAGSTYSTWRWSCPKLLPSGRCGIYEERPDVCRNFEPATSDRLCVHYMGAESGDPTLGVDLVV